MRGEELRLPATALVWQTSTLALLAAAIAASCLYAPTEATMGHAQRIIYVHVPVAWLGLVAFILMAGFGVAYLSSRNLAWDHWSRAAAELSWLCTGLTLATGSIWAHEAWGTWWEWDPRLTAAFILWAICAGILLVRSGLDDPHQQARVGAVLAILGTLDIPLVVMATRWFRGMHPVAPEMAPPMRMALLVSTIALTVFVAGVLNLRRQQLRLEQLAERLERTAGADA